jgi:hypothetical protein
MRAQQATIGEELLGGHSERDDTAAYLILPKT